VVGSSFSVGLPPTPATVTTLLGFSSSINTAFHPLASHYSHSRFSILLKPSTVLLLLLHSSPFLFLSLSSIFYYYNKFWVLFEYYSFKEKLASSDPQKLPGSSCCILGDLRNTPRISPYGQ